MTRTPTIQTELACRCPIHANCHRKVRTGRHYCSTCIDLCGPFGWRKRHRTGRRVYGVGPSDVSPVTTS